jgi:hydrogenase maturation protease
LLHLWQGVQAAILIDALVCDSPCGTLHRFGPELLAGNDRSSSHGFGVAEALALGRVIGALPRHLALVGISASGDEPPPIDPAVLIPMIETIAKEMGLASS